MPRLSKTLATALFKPSAEGLSLGSAPGTLTFEYRDESGLNARKTFELQPEGKAYVLKVQASIDLAGASRPVTLAWGPGLGLGYSPDGSSTGIPSAPCSTAATTSSTSPPAISRSRGATKASSCSPASKTTTSWPSCSPGTERVAVEYPPVTLPVPNDAAAPRRAFVVVQRVGAGIVQPAVLPGTQGLRHPARRRAAARARDRLRDVRRARRAAAARPEVDQRLRPQLRLVDRRADDPHQPGDLPAAPPQHGLDAEDAGAPAGDQGASRTATPSTSSPIPSARR